MKKFLMMFLMALGFVAMANAQSCVLKGANDGSSVAVTGCSYSNGNVTVSVYNDSPDFSANVQVTVEVTYGNNTRNEYTCPYAVTVKKDSSAEIKFPVPEKSGCTTVSSVRAKSITGSKCQ